MAKSSSPQQNDASSELESAGVAESSEQHEREYVLMVQRQDALEKPETRRIVEIKLTCSPATSLLLALWLARETKAKGALDPAGSVAIEGDCFEGLCGGCSILVNGRVALACGVLIGEAADKQNRVRLAPMSSFALVRDLVVDRSRAFRMLQGVPVVGPLSASTPVRHETPSATQALEQAGLDRCHRCGACLEACPQYGPHSEFVGALTLHEVRLRNTAVLSQHARVQRVEAMMAPGGVQSCGKAQTCVEVCPAALPLVDSIQSVARETSKQMLLGWLSK